MTEKTEAPPLTDEDLATIEGEAAGERAYHTTCQHTEGWMPEEAIARLVAEVRRLRAFDPGAEAMDKARRQVSATHVGAGYEIEVLRVARDIERRLRSDEWLLRAADEIASEGRHPWEEDKDIPKVKAETLAILRKHRDGKA